VPTSDAEVVIPRPTPVVWEFCTNAENAATYLPGTVEVHQLTDGPLAVGTLWRGRSRFLGPVITWTGSFTDVEEFRLTVFHSTGAPFWFTSIARYAEHEDGTRMSLRIETEAGLGGLFGRLADPIVEKAYSRVMQVGLENLVVVLTAE